MVGYMAKFVNRSSCYIAKGVKFGKGVIIYPNVVIEGIVTIGSDTIIYNGCYIKNSTIGENNIIYSSHIINSDIGDNNLIGPYAYIRDNNVIKDNTRIGSFVEVKNSVIDDDTRVSHLSYIGDSTLGKNINIGCGVVTANYDGKNKYQTRIDDDAFIGCNTNLIAPINIGKKAYIAAGSTITKDVLDNEFAIARSVQQNQMRRD